jgi:predicted dehydrogenase/nucleoside-diphosphate-sugar epimerase
MFKKVHAESPDRGMADAVRLQPGRPAKSGPLRVALVGCGAIAGELHLPVLAGHEDVQIAALVDRDVERARGFAGAYKTGVVLRDIEEISADQIDAAIIATPPFHHAPGAIVLMRRGVHVLVEKPMALNLAEAREMCSVADETGVVLAVGLYKRLLPAVRLMADLVQRQQWGAPISFSYEWGGLAGYASATLGLMRKEYAGGGVLLDLGAHVFDQLVAVFGRRGSILAYRDDARGGIEADCTAEVAFESCGRQVHGRVELSRVRNLANRLEINCESATLSLALNERFAVTVRPKCGEMLQVRSANAKDVSWYETYRAEIDDWIQAIRSGSAPELSGKSALASVSLIDDCYRNRKPLTTAWLDQMPASRVPPGVNGSRQKVLITGAGGFIGSRAAEILSLRDGHQVRAMVHRAATASRLSRLPIEMVQGDLKSDADVFRAIDGCDAVVHCAVGTAYGQPREIEAVTVGGTKRLAAAARIAGVRRFVHLSSIGVHDSSFTGVIDGSTPVRPERGDWYGRTKAMAETAVRSEEKRGLSVVVLRPGCVFGPYGFTFVINPLRALATGRLVLAEAADSPSNTVFVDNLVEAIACALAAPDDRVFGRSFAIGDGDGCTWGEYYGWFADRLGVSFGECDQRCEANPPKRNGFLAGIGATVASPEAKAFAKRILHSDPLGTAPRWLLARFPGIEPRLRALLGMNEPAIYRRPIPTAPDSPIVIRPRAGRISIAEAKRDLGFSPPVDRARALELTWEWVRYARIV